LTPRVPCPSFRAETNLRMESGESPEQFALL
jgi:hypothetical protein